MSIENNLIIAKQQASQAKGQNFYVTKKGIKRDFNLLGGSFIYKVYFNTEINVEDSKGEKIKNKKAESKSNKATLSSKLRDSKNEAASKNDES